MQLLRVGVTVLVLGVLTLVLMPVQWLATRRNWPLANRLPYHWQRIACRLIGIRVHAEGTPAKPPLLIAANHISWLDVSVLGSVLPVSYVAKSEVAGWPILGTLARLQRSVFIDRTRRSQTASANQAIGRRMGAGENIVLFAEGTTGDGNSLLPFRSALLGAASAAASGSAAITVQPVAISYVGLQGIPVGRADRPHIAWYGDMPFVAHFLTLARHGAIDVVISFGEPIDFGPGYDRKKAAEACYASVRRMIGRSRRVPLAALDARPRRLFSRPGKGAKGAADARAAPRAEPGESIASRIS